MIIYADDSLKEKLEHIFNVCFPGESDFCSYFFKNVFVPRNTLVDIEGDNVRGMAMELPYNINGLGDVTYLYAVATLPKYRNRGICRSIIERSHAEDIKKGRKASILIPGNTGLFDFYEKSGYKKAAFVKEGKASLISDKKGYHTHIISPADALDIYDRSLSGNAYIKRDTDSFKEQVALSEAFGGGCMGLFYEGRPCAYCFYSYDDENNIFFDEIMGENKELLMSMLLKKFNKTTGKFRTAGHEKPFGMAYFYHDELKYMYINLMYN